MTVPVTIVSCLYGNSHNQFVLDWWNAVLGLDPKPADVFISGTETMGGCSWKHPQAYYLQQAIKKAVTDWVVIADIDDQLFPDALAGIEDVDADVWALGYERSDGEIYLAPQVTAAEILAAPHSIIPGSSAIRTDAFHECGGFRDVALQDWALWRSLAKIGARFQSSDRAHFRYMRHPAARGELELTMAARPAHLAEMMEAA